MVLPTGVGGRLREALVTLRREDGVPIRAGGGVFRHGGLEFVEAEVFHAAPAGGHFARETGGAASTRRPGDDHINSEWQAFRRKQDICRVDVPNIEAFATQ